PSYALTSMAPGCETARPILERTRAASVSSSASPLLKTDPACAASPRMRLLRSREIEPAAAPVLLIAWAALSFSLARRHAPRSGSNKYINPAPTPRDTQAVIAGPIPSSCPPTPRPTPPLPPRPPPPRPTPTLHLLAPPRAPPPFPPPLFPRGGIPPDAPVPKKKNFPPLQFSLPFTKTPPGFPIKT